MKNKKHLKKDEKQTKKIDKEKIGLILQSVIASRIVR